MKGKVFEFQKFMARYIQPFRRLLDTNKQTNKQTDKPNLYIDLKNFKNSFVKISKKMSQLRKPFFWLH